MDRGAGDDYFKGAAGNDTIEGLAPTTPTGHRRMTACGNEGADWFWGNAGNDTIDGGIGLGLALWGRARPLYGRVGKGSPAAAKATTRSGGGAHRPNLYGDRGNELSRGRSRRRPLYGSQVQPPSRWPGNIITAGEGRRHPRGGAGNDVTQGTRQPDHRGHEFTFEAGVDTCGSLGTRRRPHQSLSGRGTFHRPERVI